VELLARLLKRALGMGRGPYSPLYELYPKLGYVTLRTSNGCPFQCSYCGWHLMDGEFSRRDPQETASEIERFHKKLSVRDFAFYDEALLYEAETHIIPIIETILKKGIRANFHTPNGLHAAFLTKELATLLKRAGFVGPRLGFETSDRALQRRTGGKVSNEDLVKAVSLLKKVGYRGADIGVYLLIGLPGQKVAQVEESIRFTHKLGVRVYLEEYSPVPGTPDYERSGLAEDADPLMHNNFAFPLYGRRRFLEFQELKTLNTKLNNSMADPTS
jgi:radical SAM superfamily enzyme YgiQ (UPF0313 family)